MLMLMLLLLLLLPRCNDAAADANMRILLLEAACVRERTRFSAGMDGRGSLP
jgi:hypothetical protein